MKVSLVPRAARSDILRIWIGVLSKRLPALHWLLDGEPLDPARVRVLSPISSAIPPDLLGGQPPTNFTGVYEIGGLTANTQYLVGVEVGAPGEKAVTSTLRTKTIPSAVPALLERPFNVLLVSCFHQAEDRAGRAGALAQQLTGPVKPDLMLLLGDQVYLDLPTLANFPDDEQRLAQKFENDYRVNWQSDAGYSQLLTIAPSISLPDDHEFWNNYPHQSPIIQNSWKPEGQRRWKKAAIELYKAFQFSYEQNTFAKDDAAQLGDATVINVDPLSFFLVDGRTMRDPNRSSVLTARAYEQLEQWVDETVGERKIGIFTTGQSLLDPAASRWEGRVADYTMPNYKDFPQITAQLARLADAGLPLLLITGDVHWGRVAGVRDVVTSRESIFEIISSPTSLVTSVGKDQWSDFMARIRAIGGAKNPWPRHSEPAKVPDRLWSRGFGARFSCWPVHEQKGNHITLLSFSRSGTGVQLRTTYYPIHEDPQHAQPHQVREITLIPA